MRFNNATTTPTPFNKTNEQTPCLIVFRFFSARNQHSAAASAAVVLPCARPHCRRRYIIEMIGVVSKKCSRLLFQVFSLYFTLLFPVRFRPECAQYMIFRFFRTTTNPITINGTDDVIHRQQTIIASSK